MVIFGDYHTHTNFSRHNHGKGTILENAQVAAQKGLKQIAITDHGFAQKLFGIDRRDIPVMKQEILTAKNITGLDILFGIEANLLSLDGKIDIKQDDLQYFDIIAMGYHKIVGYSSFKDFYNLGICNYIRSVFAPSKSTVNKNTTAFLRAIDKNNIDIITHLNHDCAVDVLAVAKLAAEKGVLIEINGRRNHFSDEQLLEMADAGVKFIVNSDAHRPEDIGEVNLPINKIIQLNIPVSQVVNIDKLPNFKK